MRRTRMMMIMAVMLILVSNQVMAVADTDYEVLTDKLNQPQGMCFNEDHEVFVADTYNNRIAKLSQGELTVFAGISEQKDIFGFPKGGLLDGSLATAMFNRPRDIAYVGDGVFYIADTDNHVIRKIEDGQVVTVAGNGEAGYINGLNYKSRFNTPSGIAVGSDGKIYVADTLNNAIRVIDQYGSVMTMILKAKFNDDAHLFNEPSDLYFDAKNQLYVVDAGNQMIKRIVDGEVEVIAGKKGALDDDGYMESGYENGDSQEASFAFPKGIAVKDDLVYVAYTWNHAIRLVKPDGQVMTMLGDGNPGSDVVSRGSSLNGPSAIEVMDSQLLISDKWNDRLLVIDLDYGQPLFDLALDMPSEGRTDEIDVFIGMEKVAYNDVPPLVIEDDVFYPVRVISEKLGATVSYNRETEVAAITLDEYSLEYNIYSDAVRLENSRTFINIRDLATALGFFVTIDDDTNDVMITRP